MPWRRNLARTRDEVPIDDPFIDTPPWLAVRWRRIYGDETAAAIAGAHRVEAALDITPKADPAGWAEKLDGDVLATGSVRLRSHVPVP